MLDKCEREINFIKTDDENEFNVYCTSPSWIRKIEKADIKSYKEDYIDGELVAKYYRIDKSRLSIKKKRKPMTEEQRLQASERAKKNFRKDK